MSIYARTTLLVLLAMGAGASAVAEQRFECLVEPSLKVEISGAVSGILDEVLVDRGDQVETGQVLARLQSGLEQAQLDLARARLEFATRKVQRNEELYRKQMISIHEKDEMETELLLLQLELREIEELLALRTIKSPLSGVVVERLRAPGELVQEDVILVLAQIDPLRVELVIPSRFWGRIQQGESAQVEWEAPVGGSHPAQVTVVDPVVDAASGTLGVRLELANPDHRLPAGTKCWVRFPNLPSDAD